jgi:Arc/MetJ family transcription regulator
MNEQFDNRYTLIDSADQQNFYPNTLATRTQITLTDAAAATTLPSETGFVQTALQTLRNSVKAALSYFSGSKLNLANITSSATANRILRTGTANAAPTWAQVALTTDVSGALPVANGGTAATTAATALTNLGAASSANL